MKKIICLLVMLLSITTISFAEDTKEIIDSQKDSLNISGFLKEANSYTKSTFSDMDFNQLLNDAIAGKINHETIGKTILSLLGKEVMQAIKMIRKYYGSYYYS